MAGVSVVSAASSTHTASTREASEGVRGASEGKRYPALASPRSVIRSTVACPATRSRRSRRATPRVSVAESCPGVAAASSRFTRPEKKCCGRSPTTDTVRCCHSVSVILCSRASERSICPATLATR